MTRFEREFIDVLEQAPTNRASKIHLVDEVDLRVGEFTMAEFDEILETLQEEGAIRVRNPSAPEHDRIIQHLGGSSEKETKDC